MSTKSKIQQCWVLSDPNLNTSSAGVRGPCIIVFRKSNHKKNYDSFTLCILTQQGRVRDGL